MFNSSLFDVDKEEDTKKIEVPSAYHSNVLVAGYDTLKILYINET